MLHIQYRKKAFADIKEPCSLAKGRSVTLGLKGGEGLSFSGFITSSFSLSAMHCSAGEDQADEGARVAWLSWRVSGR